VLIGAGGTGIFATRTDAEETAQNLAVAINDTGTCGYPSGGPCTRNVSAVNPLVSSTDTSGSASQTMTARCADNTAITNSSGTTSVTVNNVVAGGAGTTSGTHFALGTNTATATNIAGAVTTNTTAAGVSASPSSNVVTLSANTWGAAGNSDTLTETATSGVTVSAFGGGTTGSNTGTDFDIDNVPADAATNLAAAITRNGSTVGVSANSSGAMVTVTATTAGTAGNSITLAEGLTNFSWNGTTLQGGTNGSDYVFMSTYESSETGCSTSTNNGCVLSFNVTNGSSFSSSLTPSGVLNISGPATASPTGGFIIDNSSTTSGASQIYFLTQDTSGTSPCTGTCGVQASQSAP
jgi:hypothetical protein